MSRLLILNRLQILMVGRKKSSNFECRLFVELGSDVTRVKKMFLKRASFLTICLKTVSDIWSQDISASPIAAFKELIVRCNLNSGNDLFYKHVCQMSNNRPNNRPNNTES